MSPPGKEQKEEKEKRHYTVPKHYKVPRKPVAKALEALDNLDCPDKPGMVYETTLKAMVDRFYEVFGDKSEAASKLREKQIEQIRKAKELYSGDWEALFLRATRPDDERPDPQLIAAIVGDRKSVV